MSKKKSSRKVANKDESPVRSAAGETTTKPAADLQWRGFTESEKAFILEQETKVRTRGPDATSGAGSKGIVIIVPGILASPIGTDKNEIWLDVTEIPRGGIKKLRLPEGDKLKARPFQNSSSILYSFYRTTESALKAAGYDTHLYPYDWRQDIGTLGKNFAKWLKDHFLNKTVSLVGHSMGGLVCRAAFGTLKNSTVKVSHFITAGTPLLGAASPLLVMRQLHAMALSIAKADPCHDAKDLANIFATFPGLGGMMPHFQNDSWFNLSNWPKDSFHADALSQSMLDTGKAGMNAMQPPPAGCSYYAIQGDGVNTISAIEISSGSSLVFTVNHRGDGTVPHSSGTPRQAENARLFYIHSREVRGLGGGDGDEAEHGSLLKRERIAKAILSLLANGTCDLPTSPGTDTWTISLTEARLRQQEGEIRSRATRLTTPEEVTDLWLRALRLTPALVPSTDTSKDSWSFPFPRTQIQRGDEARLEIELALGDIVEVPSRVILLGQFQGIDSSEATLSIDQIMDGALLKLLRQRHAAHGAGELDIIPTGRHPIMAEIVGFLGLGSRDRFSGNTLVAAAESGTHSLLASHFDEFATVLMGGRLADTTTISVKFALSHMLQGIVSALKSNPARDRFRRVVIVEKDRARLQEIHRALCLLLHEEPFTGCTYSLCSTELPQRTRSTSRHGPAVSPGSKRSHQIIINLEMLGNEGQFLRQRLTFLPASGSGAAIRESSNGKLKIDDITELYREAGIGGEAPTGVASINTLETISKTVNGFLNDGSTDDATAPTSLLPTESTFPLEIIHNAEASRIPWETLMHPSGTYPALTAGISRRYISDRSRILWPRQNASQPRILMVINPTGDLPGAEIEGEALRKLIDVKHGGFAKVTYLQREEATEANLKKHLNTEEYDILHYAGHSGFSRENPSNSGLLLHGDEYFTGSDALGLARFPSIVVFNSCQAARIRRRDPVVRAKDGEISPALKARLKLRDNAHAMISIAEAFLISGIQHYVGTFWPVQDDPAKDFASTLYEQLAKKHSFGHAILSARQKLHAEKKPDWANYIHYGDPQDIPFGSDTNA